MTDYLKLAMAYGGFTSLDKVYLERALADKSRTEKLQFITPPPSVLNAYFAEIYDKQGPQAATSYYYELSKALELFPNHPSFAELYPFVRLNLNGKAYGFAYVTEKEKAAVFAEKDELVTDECLIQLAQLFPHYQVYEEGRCIWMEPFAQNDRNLSPVEASDKLLTDICLSEKLVKIQGYNSEEILEIAQQYSGQRYYHVDQGQITLYVTI